MIDVFFSSLALLILSPLFIIIIIILRFTGEHKVFYIHERVGFKTRPFKMLKFASMIKDSLNLGTGSLTLRNDSRVTPVGKYLRITKLNELPQIINVFLGNMSLVGPRPQLEVDFRKFPEYIQKEIYNVKPGISGISSIVFRDEEDLFSKSDLPPHEFYRLIIAPYKGELELWYQKRKSILLDFQIIFLTVWIIIFPKSNLAYKMFKTLPQKSAELLQHDNN